MNNKETRWKQRFQNYTKAFAHLEAAVQINKLSNLERAGLIQTFEFSFELAWKTLKDFLESEGITTTSPRQIIQEAFKANYITDGHTWIDALEKRNFLSHCYSEEVSSKSEDLIKNNYYTILKEFQESFEAK